MPAGEVLWRQIPKSAIGPVQCKPPTACLVCGKAVSTHLGKVNEKKKRILNQEFCRTKFSERLLAAAGILRPDGTRLRPGIAFLRVIFKDDAAQDAFVEEVDDKSPHGQTEVVSLENGHDFAEELGLLEAVWFLCFDGVEIGGCSFGEDGVA